MPEPLPDGAALLADLTEPERRAALLLVYGTGDVALAAARARELAPRDAVEARLLALMDLLGPAAAKAVVAGSPLGARLVNALAGVVDTLDKHRGRGQQLVRVEHVHVHPGGQAVVGVVGRGRGDGAGIGHQSHAPRLAHEPGAAVRGADPGRQPVPAAQGEGAAAVPDARGSGRRARGSGERGVAARPAQRRGAGGAGVRADAARDGQG
jgi:hypothetical protein